jgi:hypothetical protein
MVICDRWGMTLLQLRAPDRSQEAVSCRRTIAHYLHGRGLGPSGIGRYLCRDHSTILHYLRSPLDYWDSELIADVLRDVARRSAPSQASMRKRGGA